MSLRIKKLYVIALNCTDHLIFVIICERYKLNFNCYVLKIVCFRGLRTDEFVSNYEFGRVYMGAVAACFIILPGMGKKGPEIA